MKILLIHPNDVVTTPTTVRIVRLAQELERRGHSCVLAYFREDVRRRQGLITTDERALGLEVHSLDPFLPIRNSAILTRLARRSDLVHLQKAIPYAALPAMTGALMAGKPLHYDWDDLEGELARLIHRRSFYPRWIDAFEKRLPLWATSVTVSSEWLRRKAIELGARDSSVTWLPVGADPADVDEGQAGERVRAKHRFPVSAPILLYAGHLEAGSGARLFIDAVGALVRSHGHLNPHAVIVGGGLHESAYRRYVHSLGLEDRIVLTGYVPRADIPEYLAAASVNLVALEDTLFNRCKSPLKLVEAMAAGRPVVATDVGEVGRLLGCAELLSRPNAQELAEVCARVLEGKIPATIGGRLKRRAEEEFTWARAAERLEGAYRNAGFG